MSKKLPANDRNSEPYALEKTEEYIQKSQIIRQGYDRFDELMNAIDWALKRRPHFYSKLGAGNYYIFDCARLANSDFPNVQVAYRIFPEEKRVVLLDIE